ncbi:FAD:protein FMN transferase [Aestuariibius sp. HNIBRBA575]|uniref:FAD:protein FMN transferase n=1 Tax=Aestuariibius sp. HNIBRBA575 TaxID=3233343 RepID=UPI0034A39F25
MTIINRRRFLAMSASTLAVPAMAGQADVAIWRGSALGAPASLHIVGLSQIQAQPIFDQVEAELLRLELIYSLYRPNSQIMQLNTTGVLDHPAPELLGVLSLSGALHDASDGAFDPTIQPVWQARAGLDAANGPVGWSHLRFDTQRVVFERPGMAMTLNGIAQGAVTDQIATLLRGMGLQNILIDMGEVAAIGGHENGSDWQVGIADPEGQIIQRITLRDRALATSAPMPSFGSDMAHIFHPNGTPAVNQLVSISAPSAMLADGLSTTICMAEPSQVRSILQLFPHAHVEKIMSF